MPKNSKKIYCYVDESGQDTKGKLFFVSVIIVTEDKEILRNILTNIEQLTQKNRRKWSKSKSKNRLGYILKILKSIEFKAKMFYSENPNTKDYFYATVQTVVRVIHRVTAKNTKAVVIVDGLEKSRQSKFGFYLRRGGIGIAKVRSADEQHNEFLRLADAVCGFTRAALTDESLKKSLETAEKKGFIIKIGTN